MSLLGLARREASGHPVPVDIRAALQTLLAAPDWARNLGDMGLMLWLCGEVAPEAVPGVCRGLNPRNGLRRFCEVRAGKTMELAWLLAGLAHVKLSSRGDTPDLTATAFEVYRLLGTNQGPHGIFGHSARGRSLAGMFRGHIGSFADQVYSIYALARYGQAYGVEPALDMARRCGEAICRMQGPAGQWWWHYDARTGRVFEEYPVYSVHQHGMAPMALFALGEATGIDFRQAIYQGLQWVSETNELHTEMSIAQRKLIWRGICLSSMWRISSARARSLLGREGRTPGMGDLMVQPECRPYELGWLLYAFAGRQPAMNAASEIAHCIPIVP